ncbi:MAG: hypothetical protein E6I87_11035 [Chloroflexi bacterium]|nr:MAG: hypothetical protein E6I87_11035 [Chloroflexota bacterium]
MTTPVALTLLLLLATACGNGPDLSRHTDDIVWNGVLFTVPFESTGRGLTENDLASELFRVRSAVPRASMPLGDRDAAYVSAGEPVYAVKSYAATFRLAARHDGRLFLYESRPHPGVKRGADLLDIEGRVVAIAVLSSYNAGEIARITDPRRVGVLVHAVSVAAVDLAPPWGVIAGPKTAVFLAFELSDGTRTVRALDPNRNVLADVIHVDAQFTTMIDEILRDAPCTPDC